MLKYTTILESKKFKVSKVKNTKTNKSWYSFIHYIKEYTDTAIQERTAVIMTFGEQYTQLSGAREWKFKDLATVKKKYNWALLRWA